MFELNNRFVFHWTWTVDIQLIIELLQLIHDFLTSGNKITSYVYTFLILLITDVSWWTNVSGLFFSLDAKYNWASSNPMHPCSFWALTSSAQILMYVQWTKIETYHSKFWFFLLSTVKKSNRHNNLILTKKNIERI